MRPRPASEVVSPDAVLDETAIFDSEPESLASKKDAFPLETESLLAEEIAASMQPPGVDELASLHENAKFLQDLATRIWRASKQLDKALQKSDEAHLERFARRFEEIGETLADYGIEIIDHTPAKITMSV